MGFRSILEVEVTGFDGQLDLGEQKKQALFPGYCLGAQLNCFRFLYIVRAKINLVFLAYHDRASFAPLGGYV